MMDTGLSGKYYGKIMMFGEYSVMQGSWAALIPYRKVSARLVMPDKLIRSKEAVQSNLWLKDFAAYLVKEGTNRLLYQTLDIGMLTSCIEKGVFLESKIPCNYGLGSSGAVCAAVFNLCRRNTDKISPGVLRQLFSFMESFFHGSSSGVDPLCIYLNQPLVVKNTEYELPGEQGAFSNNTLTSFLIDTGQFAHTAPLISLFNEELKKEDYRDTLQNRYIPEVNHAVRQWLNGHLQEGTIFAISRLQQRIFTHMIPYNFKEVWEQGLLSGLYALKLCGSGGGGMLLGFTAHIEETKEYLIRKFNIRVTVLNEQPDTSSIALFK